MNTRTGIKKTLGITIAAAATLSMFAGSAAAATTCSLVASPTGSDSNSGSISAPFQTPQKLVFSLAPGQVGCLRGGTYNEDVKFVQAGSAGAPITLTSFPGETATIIGRMWVPQGADYVTVTDLHLDGQNSGNLPSPTIDSANATFSHDDVTDDHTAICFALGDPTWGTASNTLITDNRIHDCGLMPAGNYNHGIYVADATNTQISWNLIYDNADRGIQLYPNAQNTTIDHNILDGNGEDILFSGEDGQASSGANVYDNILSGAKIRHDVESWYPAGNPVGTDNLVHNNCVWGGKQGTIDSSTGGFHAYNNKTINPEYVDAAAHSYRLQPTSPCLAMIGNIAAAVDGASTTAVTAGIARVRRHKAHLARLAEARRSSPQGEQARRHALVAKHRSAAGSTVRPSRLS
jgi:parallel beta-helix repeat protein